MYWQFFFVSFCISFLVQTSKVAGSHNSSDSKDSGSTLNLKTIVLGRCWYYKQLKKQNAQRKINCSSLWEAFHSGFAYKNPCKLTFSDYEPFFDLLKGVSFVDVNKSLLWSGTYKAVHSYSEFDLRFTTLEDTLEGYMMNELTWCGSPSLPRNTSDGIDYNSCPPYSSSCDLTTPFWGQASKRFAERARGVVRVMVNGSRVGRKAYNRESYFGLYELPNFEVSNITRLEILVVHTIGQKQKEKCHTDSIKLLQDDAESRGLDVVCYDDPNDVKHILCADHPAAEVCLFHSKQEERESKTIFGPIVTALVATSAVLLTAVVILLVVIICCRKKIIANDKLSLIM